MAERYQKLFALSGCFYNEECPVFVHDGAITKDNDKGRVFIQLKMENFSNENKELKAVTLSFDLADTYGKEIQKGFEYQYLDLNCKPGEIFGQKTPVYIDDSSVRSFSFTVKQVLFADGSEWKKDELSWNEYPKQKKLEESGFDAQQIKQFKSETQNKAEFCYVNFDKLWFCTCGKANLSSSEKCTACSLEKEYLEKATPDYLRSNAIYADAMSNMNAGKYDEAIRLFGFIKDWRDADTKVQECEEKIVEKRKKKKKRRIGCFSAFIGTVIAIILFVTVGIPAIAYGIGSSNMKKGNYEAAAVVFTFLSVFDYRDSSEKYVETSLYLVENERAKGLSTIEYNLSLLFSEENWITELTDEMTETAYNWAVKQAEEGNYYLASHVFDCISDYKDSFDKMTMCNAELIATAQPGSYIRFGTFEQTPLFSSKEFIDWKVLAKDENKILVVSDRALTRHSFSENAEEVSWADSAMRSYLNSDFISEAFTSEEEARIQTVYLEDNFNYVDESYSAPVTQDRVFLLSMNEIASYLPETEDAECIASNEVVAGEYDIDTIVTVSWALRSPGFVIDMDGKLIKASSFYKSELYVRPAMWITII